ncbi:hypothetical protein GCM10023216_29730 [Isoptericola chiayiensis]|uniref:DUF1876 domain-containing protein n=1 Tax=Isoptericola chiayiensis TaxID=579446 RepID=A0ABP8YN34_9MICO|nr:DUF1876 domain-containing protein [Isoptericola chiayiensis]NOW01871.1 hypothetical protein [Isoptericola chiayiensis]
MTHTWKIALQFFDADDLVREGRRTSAHAVLTTAEGATLEGHGHARRNPQDPSVPEIGLELAASRALRDLADRLLAATSEDIAAIEHHPVHLHA